MRNLSELNRHRQVREEIKRYGGIGTDTGGLFAFKSPVDGKTLWVIAASGDGWDHVSVSKTASIPKWQEMEFIKRKFFHPHEVCMQLHVAEAEHISFHANVLHMWRPHEGEIPLPPFWMVGPSKTRDMPADVKEISDELLKRVGLA